MTTFLVKLRTTSKVYQFSSTENFKVGDKVLVDTTQGVEIGTILQAVKDKSTIKSAEVEKSEGTILRKLNPEDKKKIEDLREKAEEALEFCQRNIKEIGLPMKLLDGEFSLDEKKLTFYFTAEDRIDFRELLGKLISHFHKNIRLQQLGSRDAAKIIGGMGPCGRPLCCQTFLENIDTVSVEMAKEQDLATVGSSKISGACGKLMCCLAYEVELYEKMRKNLPKIAEEIETEKGKGKVIAQNVLRQTVLVVLEDGTKIEQKIK